MSGEPRGAPVGVPFSTRFAFRSVTSFAFGAIDHLMILLQRDRKLIVAVLALFACTQLSVLSGQQRSPHYLDAAKMSGELPGAPSSVRKLARAKKQWPLRAKRRWNKIGFV
jgi:hypothetical protein